MRNLLDQIKQDIDNFVKDAESHVAKGNKAAGTRARKVSLEISKKFKEFRKKSIDAAK